MKNTRVCILSFGDRLGFTLIETIVSLGVVAIIFLAATEGTIWMAQSNKNIANSTSNASSNALGSGAFGATFGSANIAVQFEHMPIPNGGTSTGCNWTTANPASFAGAGPCVATMSNGVLSAGQVPAIVQTAGSTTPLSWIEFFRDDNAILNGVGSTVGQPYSAPTSAPTPSGANAVIQRTTPIDSQVLNALASSTTGTSYYVTWPFTPSAGPGASPLMVLQSAASSPLVFVPAGAFAASKLPGNPGRYTLMQASSFSTTMSQIQNSIYVIYNASDPTQYFFQYAANVQKCQSRPNVPGSPTATNAQLCADLIVGGDGMWSVPTAGPGKPQPSNYEWFIGEAPTATAAAYPTDTIQYFAVDWEPLLPTLAVGSSTLSAYFSPSSYFGSATNLLWNNWLTGSTVPAFYPLPSEFATLYDPDDSKGCSPSGCGDFQEYSQASTTTSPGSGVDIRRIAHYYDVITPSRNVNLMAVPVTIESINLSAPNSSTCSVSGKPTPCQTWNLVSNMITQVGTGSSNPLTKTLMSNLPLVGASNNPAATPAGAVVLARPIGTSKFQLLYFSPNGVTVSN